MYTHVDQTIDKCQNSKIGFWVWFWLWVDFV